MIPANGDFYAHFKTAEGGWPAAAATRKVIAWTNDGRPMVLDGKGLALAESLTNLVLESVQEALPVSETGNIPQAFSDEEDSGLPYMQAQTITALRNYDWLLRNKGGLEENDLHWESDTLGVRDGGHAIEEICREGFTPATRAPQPKHEDDPTPERA